MKIHASYYNLFIQFITYCTLNWIGLDIFEQLQVCRRFSLALLHRFLFFFWCFHGYSWCKPYFSWWNLFWKNKFILFIIESLRTYFGKDSIDLYQVCQMLSRALLHRFLSLFVYLKNEAIFCLFHSIDICLFLLSTYQM